jgi:xanthine dehydrogenase accessory factor
MSDAVDILETLAHEVEAGRRGVLCVVVTTRGSAPQVPGAMLGVDEAGQMTGTVGGGCVEAEIHRRAHQMLSTGQSGVFPFDLDHDIGFEDGLICGGQMDVAIRVVSQAAEARDLRIAAERLRSGEAATLPVRVQTPKGLVEYRVRLEAPPKLVIAGGGHIGLALAPLMVPLGFRVTVIDDRSRFANPTRFPPPIEPIVGAIAEALARWPIDANTYIVIVTRGHRHDEQALAAVIDSRARYIGMIGSRRKIALIYDDLRRQGKTQEQLDRVHAPIGLDIKAVTPEEIAVSIAAELISIRRADYHGVVEGPMPVTEEVS